MSNELSEVFHSMTDAFKEASAEHVYGKPVESNGTTVIPVAKIAYGFGGGGGGHKDEKGETNPHEGAGGGGGAMATPVGVVELGPQGVRMIHFNDNRKVMAAFGMGALIGSMFASRRIRRMIRLEQKRSARRREATD